MRLVSALGVALALTVASPLAARAQDDDGFSEDEFSDGDGDDVELDMAPDDLGDVDDPFPDGQPEDAEEDPDRARLAVEVEADAEAEAQAPPDPTTRAGYPIELAARPIILPATMAEARYEARLAPDPLVLGGVLELFYGVTDEVQIALRYGTGTLADAGNGTEYEPGKAISVEAVYLFNQYFGLQAEVPFYVDPFALALTLGPRFEIQAGDKLRFVTGEDMITIRLVDFVPTLDNAQQNEALAAAVSLNQNVSRGSLRFPLSVVYQKDANLSLVAEFAATFDDFDDSNGALAIEGTVNYAFTNKFDIGGRIGFLDLAEAGENFGITLFAELRI